ncbi:MAG: RNA-directed DNA polymerase [Deltaproteobacteria bacterium]|nr:RNA-directed DNA polymerase [Deltaproteobacteria bacterium]
MPDDAKPKPEKSEKQKLWERISARPDWIVVERMRVNGFWPAGETLPEDPPDEVKERAALEVERARLLKSALAVQHPEQALKAENQRRIEVSRKKKAERKVLREAAARERREAFIKKKRATLVHLGLGVSGGLEKTGADEARLQAFELPVLRDGNDVAAAIGIPLGELRWLTYHRRGAPLVHYHRYDIPKKTGGARHISAPKGKLARAQQWVLDAVLDKVPASAHAHGFVRGRSVVTNARPHVKCKSVVNLDLKDFFPTITYRRAKGLFEHLGYGEHVATVLALLCTEPPRVLVEHDERRTHVAIGERVLPQGACTSPAITNLLCRRLDARLAGLARRLGLAYTRYADDLTFSGDTVDERALLGAVRRVIAAEGFVVHPDKTRVMRKGRRQEVTGVVVNAKPSIAREQWRSLRAVLHNCAKHGLASQNREQHPDFAGHLAGKVAWVRMVDPRRGAQLGLLLQRALARP